MPAANIIKIMLNRRIIEMNNYEKICGFVKSGDGDEVVKAIDEAIAEGCDAQDILNNGLIVPLNDLGMQFQNGDIYVPELLIASEAMKKGVEKLKPLLMNNKVGNAGKCLVCTVEGDVHDIGKNLVTLFLESAGFEVIDLGVSVDTDDIIEAIEDDEEIRILGLSAMLTTTMYTMQDIIEELEDAGLRDRVKVMIGGAPVNDEFAKKIGADGYSANAPEAVELAKRLISE